MPEGHTLHRLAQVVDATFGGTSPAVSSPQGPFSAGAALLDRREVLEASAYGKHLFVRFAGERCLDVHLGLIGKLSVQPLAWHASMPAPWGAVRMRMVSDDYVADLRGATLCAVVTPDEAAATMARLGPDPLRPGQEPEHAWQRVARSGRTIAELVMDQSVLAGVGNVYRCEVLFRHRVNPFRPGREVRRSTWDAIWTDLVRLMALGVTFNQILTMEDQVEEAEARVAAGQVPELTWTWTDSARSASPGIPDDTADPRSSALPRRYYVYRRQGEPCRVCGSRVRTAVVAGRNLFWCGRCQRRR